MPSRLCSFVKPLNVAFRAWLMTALLQGVRRGNSQLLESAERNITCWITLDNRHGSQMRAYICHFMA